jgi:nitrate reductase delta subunit
MDATFKLLSALLSYPTPELQQAAPELAAVLAAESLLPAGHAAAIAPLLDELAGRDLMELQERYVALFDRNRTLSLHLFEHVHGESRDRGQAMVDLRALYERHGLEISATELPDYLPLFLEFLALRPRAEALELLAQPRDVIAALAERLRRRASAYAPVLQALAELAGARHDAAPVAELLQQPEAEPDDLEALDAAWEAEAVRFGPGAAGGAQPGGCAPASGVVARVPFPKVSSARSTSNG